MKNILTIIAIFALAGCSTTPYVSKNVKAGNVRAAEKIPNLPQTLKEGLLANRISASQNSNGDYLLLSTYREYQVDIKKYHAELLEDFFKRDRTPESIQKAVRQGKVSVGMNKSHVVIAWGDPSETNNIMTAGQKREQWVYGQSHSTRQYLYFDNGILTAIQN